MKNFTLFVFALLALNISSCQLEGETVTQDTSNNFTKTSPISSLISRVSQYETTADNVLDGTSNCSIKLPAHVTINNEYVYVFDASGFQQVQEIKDQSNADDDKVHFAFPITIVHPNYHEYTVTSEAQFDGILAGYGDDSSCHEVSCLDFNYPISVNLYNTDNQVASTVTIQTDTQLYSFIHDLNDSQIVGFVFPITMTNSENQQITINNNIALEEAINNAVADCSSAPIPTSLSDVLTSGSWHISYCYYYHDDTNLYSGYDFTFNTNGNITAVINANTIEGDWDVNSGTPPRLDLHFDGSELHDLETNWDVQEVMPTFIRLRRQASGSSFYYLSFTKN